MKIITGLGNPGEEYRNTRHNTGWLVVDKITQNHNSKLKTNKKLKAEVSEFLVGGEKVLLVKPQIFMNSSGIAVKKIVQVNNWIIDQLENLWVIHDDLDLPLGKLKIVKNRGPAGHKGVASIIKALGSREFVRFRVGTGQAKSLKLKTKSYKDYVLGGFKGEKKKLFDQSVKKCAEAVLLALDKGLAAAMNKYN